MSYLMKVYLNSIYFGFLCLCVWSIIECVLVMVGRPTRSYPGSTILYVFAGMFCCPTYQDFRRNPKCPPQHIKKLHFALWGSILILATSFWCVVRLYIIPFYIRMLL